jgi:hypothetical protein
MYKYYFLVYTNDRPGAAAYRTYINADTPYNALQMAKAQYGRLLLSQSAMLA